MKSMACEGEDMEQICLSFENWSLNDDNEIIRRLKSLTPSEVFKSHRLYKVSVIYASRGSDWTFLKQLAIAALQTEPVITLEEEQFCTDVINLLKKKEFDAIQKLFDKNNDTELLKGKSRYNLTTSLLFSGCPRGCLEFFLDLFSRLNGCKLQSLLNRSDWHGFTPLISAILAGNIECVQSLLESGADVDQSDTLLGVSFLHHHEIDIDFTLSDPLLEEDVFCSDSKPPLIYAICVRNSICVKILLNFKPDLSKLCHKKKSALCYAAESGDYQCLDQLMKTPGQLDKHGRMGNRILPDESQNEITKHGLLSSGLIFNFIAENAEKPLLSNEMRLKPFAPLSFPAEGVDDDGKKEQKHCAISKRKFEEQRNEGEEVDTDEEVDLQPVFSLNAGVQKEIKPPRITVRTSKGSCLKRNQMASEMRKRGKLTPGSSNVRALAEAALPYSVFGGDIQCVKLLLEYSGDVNSFDFLGKNALMLAAEGGKTSCVKMLLDQWANVNISHVLSFKETALMLACKNGHSECVNLLLQYNASTKSVSEPSKETALMYACRNRSTECVTILLRNKANLEAENNDCQTALSIAVMSNVDECVKILLEHNANIDHKDKNEMSALMHAALMGNDHCVDLLLKSLKNIGEHQTLEPAFLCSNSDQIKAHHFDFSANTPETEISESDEKVTISKVCHEQRVGMQDSRSNLTMLAEESLPYAVKGGNVKCVELILPHCVNFDTVENRNGKTALMLAAERGMENVVKRLLENFADVNVTADDGQETALMLACKTGHLGCVNLLLEYNTGSNTVSKLNKENALMCACCEGSAECISLLLKYNTNIEAVNDSFQTPLIVTVVTAINECVEILLRHNAKIDTKDTQRMSALMYAASMGNARCVELLVTALVKKGEHYIYGSADFSTNTFENLENNESVVESKVLHEQSDGVLNSKRNSSKSAEESLPYAVKGGNVKCVELILPLCVNLNSVENTNGETALMLAVDKGTEGSGKIECLKLLLEHGANPDIVDEDGESAVIAATTDKKMECVELLIKHGANVHLVDNNGYSALMLATLEVDSNVKWLKVLSDAGAKLDIECVQHLQNILNYPENIKFLLKEGKLFVSKIAGDEEELLRDESHRLIFYGGENHFKAVTLLMEYGVFNWKWWFTDSIYFISFIGIQASLFPGNIFHEGELVSPLQSALLFNDGKLVRYLMSNLYYSISDYRLLTSDKQFRQKLADQEKDPFLASLVEQLCSNPWNLQTLSLLTISTTLSCNGSIPGRGQQVDSLPIPEKFKSILKFKGSHSRLCSTQWDLIGNSDPKDLLCPTKQIYPPPDILTQSCDSCCTGCLGYGLTAKDTC